MGLRTFGNNKWGKLNAFSRVDVPNSIYATHIAKEPALTKFVWHWLLYNFSRKPNTTNLKDLTDKSFANMQTLAATLDYPIETVDMLTFHL